MVLLRNALCIVGGDTGALHLAAALGTPTVAIFGPTDPARNGPYRMSGGCGSASPINIVLRSAHAVTSYKRGDPASASLVESGVDDVFESCSRLADVCR